MRRIQLSTLKRRTRTCWDHLVSQMGAAPRQVLAEGHKVLYKQLLAWLAAAGGSV